MTVPMIATQKLTYNKRALKPDDEFDASARDARILQTVGKAKPKPAAAKEVKEVREPDEQEAKRKYRRRDLQAEE